MWIVRLALTHPYTFIVLALLILIIGPLSIYRTPTDIFPNIDIPVVSVVWNYSGLPPEDMANYITSNFERALTTTVNDIEHIESQSLIGVSVVKIFFHSNVKISFVLSQVIAIAQTLLRTLPPGTTPPLILSYNASTVPVLQLMLSSNQMAEQQLFDFGNNFIRTQLATVQGAAVPYPYGGKIRQIQVDLNPQAMQTYGVSAQNVNTAITSQNIIIPAGTQKIGTYEYIVKLNASPTTVEALNLLPIRSANGSVLYVRDVAHVRDGFSPQTNIVRADGIRAVMMSIQKTGNASTLEIINNVKNLIPKIRDVAPPELKLTVFGDQSIFVTAAISSVIREGIIAAILTGLMILLFLGSWRSTFIITVSIPLSILSSIIILSALGETINIMTLGGLALAVGILVDDATVAIENINWNLEQGKEVEQAILDGADQIAIPALVSTLCICIVFVPMFFLQGVARYLFVPLAEAVVFAMLASYVLSRTLVPTLAKYWLHKQDHNTEKTQRSYFERLYKNFETGFERFRDHYKRLLTSSLQHAKLFVGIFLAFLLISLALLLPWLGTDFFPTVDAGQIKLHVRSSTGMRVEETAKICDEIDNIIRQIIPPQDLESIVDNIGLPYSGINLTYSNSAAVGPEDADILISLKKDHLPTADYVRKLRNILPNKIPGVTFAFLPADIVAQILNFGLPSPINVQVVGMNNRQNLVIASKLLEDIKKIPGIVDARLRQSYNYPQLNVDVDRSLARELGFTQLDVASNLLISLSGSFQTNPTFWVDPNNGVAYPITSQVPQYNMDSLNALENIPITNALNVGTPQILGALATIKRTASSVVESHYNVQPVLDIFASVQGRDLGGVAHDINTLIAQKSKDLPKGTSIVARGQIKTQADSFKELGYGLLFSILLVYLLIVVNFQSWSDPFIIITALPAAIAGIAWMLFLTHTTISVPALTGAIMCMGVATANSILVVSFARRSMDEGNDAFNAVLEAGYTRIRPVLMTALAMIIGMLPMALAWGEGAEQNAPLGRAVIGGLIFATIATLFFVPAVFLLMHNKEIQAKANA
jgi:CzcA family heavy metal efflux pump